MGLRSRTLTIVALVMGGLFLVLFLIAYPVFDAAFDRLEFDRAEVEGERVLMAYDQEVDRLRHVAADWAPRNVVYQYMQGSNPDLEQEMTADTLAEAGVSAFLLFDENGILVASRFIDLDLRTLDPNDQVVLDAVAAHADELMSPGDPRASTAGTIPCEGGVLMVAGRSVTTADLYGTPEGTLVVARYFDEAELDVLESVVGLNVVAVPAQSGDTSIEQASEFAADEIVRVDQPQPGLLCACTLVRDLRGEPALLLKADVPRTVQPVGRAAIWSFAISLMLVGAAAIGSVSLLMSKRVLNRIESLSTELAQVTLRRDLATRVYVRGDDEIASLATDINDALGALQESESELKQAHDELETRVFERTEELHDSEKRYRSLVERLADGIFVVDLDGVVTFANRRAEEIAERRGDELVGARFLDLLSPPSAEEVSRRISAGTAHLVGLTLEVKMGDPACGSSPVELRSVPLFDDAGLPSGTQWIARDIAERKRFEEQLVHMANHDYLTGLFNRQFFESSLEIELAESRRSGRGGAVLWLDVDDFKEVNDSLGHRAGDEVLVELSTRLRKEVRESSVLCRLGGDEFAVLLPGTSSEEAESVAERLLNAINSHVYTAVNHSVRLSASIGVVLYPEHGSTSAEVLANADVAMYLAKASGRSCVHMHQIDATLQSEMLSRLHWNERLSQALREDRFVVYAQPILDLRTDVVTRYELLIRMIVDDQIVGPAEFLPAAERLGVIRDIDRWMVSQAMRLLAEDAFGGASLEVNLSGRAFGDVQLLPLIERELKVGGIEPSRLGFEITETAAIGDMTKAQGFICTLKQLGCRFSLDDFGSGFSSFYYLKHLPIDALKVDGSFVRSLPDSPQDQHLVRALVELCRGLDVEIAVEYVEDEPTLELVRELGVDLAQGYHIGRPESVEVLRQTAGGAA